AAKDKVDSGMASLKEQQAKVAAGKPDMEALVGRMNLIRTALGTAGNNLRDSQQAYDNILKEMDVNRVRSTRKKQIQDKVIDKLDRIVVGDNATYSLAEDAYGKIHELVETDANSKRDPDVALYTKNMNESYERMDRLSKEIQQLLDAMSEGMVESQLIAII